MEIQKSSYTEAQKKAIKKYNENNREKINELQRNRYKKNLIEKKELQFKKEEELKNNILEELEEERKKKCNCDIIYENQKENDIYNFIDELYKYILIKKIYNKISI